MGWDGTLKEIIDYVEQHLQRKEEPVDPGKISQMAGCSYDFFLKVFSYMNEISFAEYIRSRKMTLAGYDLKSTDMRIVDISYKYGYDSPTSFTRAFQQFHGLTPKEARETDAELRVYPRMQLSDRETYVWRMEHKAGFTLAGRSIRLSASEEAYYQKIRRFWSDSQKNGFVSKLLILDKGEPHGLFGVCGGYDQGLQETSYGIMVCSGQMPEEDYEMLEIPETTWAVFDCYGPGSSAIQKGWQYLREEWVVRYPFRHAPCPELEWYSDGDVFAEDYLTQIWIPVMIEEDN